jgi:hypothetical protein
MATEMQLYRVRDSQGNVRTLQGPPGASKDEIIAKANELLGTAYSTEKQLSETGPADAQSPDGKTYRFPDELRAFQFSREMLSTKTKDPKELDFIAKNYQGAPAVNQTKPAEVSELAAFTKGVAGGLANVGLGIRDYAGRGLTFLGAADLGRAMSEPVPGARQAIKEELAPYEAGAPGYAFAGNVIGEGIGTAPVGFGLGSLAGLAGPRAAPLKAALQTGGMVPGPLTFGNAATRAFGGAVGGGVGAALTGDDVETGAGLGALLPFGARAAGKTVGGAINFLRPLFAPKGVAVNALREAAGDADLAAALQRTADLETTPGFKLNLAERALEGGAESPSLAALQARAAAASPKISQMATLESRKRISALEDQLARVQNEARARGDVGDPSGQLERMHAEIIGAIEREQDNLVRQAAELGETLPKGQREAGKVLGSRGEAAERGVRARFITPAYEKAFKAAGDVRIDLSDIVAKADEIRGRTLTGFAPETAPGVISALSALTPPPAAPVPLGKSKTLQRIMVQPPEPPPPMATLRQLDEIRKGLNADIAAAKISTSPMSRTTLKTLQEIGPMIDAAIANSKLSAQAKDAYTEALDLYKGPFVSRFKTGLPPEILRQTRNNEPKVLPDNVVSAFLKNERGAEQFVNLYRGDPKAARAMSDGIEDLFRQEVIDPVTKAVDPRKAAGFLQRYELQLKTLEQSGVNVQGSLDAVRQRAEFLSNGITELAAQSKLAGTKTPQELVTKLIASPAQMDFTLSKLSSTGRAAITDEVSSRIAKMAPDEAISFLLSNPKNITKALGGSQTYDELMDLSRFRKEIVDVEKSMPRNIGPKVAVDVGRATQEELTDLIRLANDVKRMKYVDQLAGEGLRVPSPLVGKLVTESSAAAGMSSREIPTLLDAKVSIARSALTKIEGWANKRAAAQLADYMFKDPDAVIEALQNKAKLAARVKMLAPVTTAGRGVAARSLSGMYNKEDTPPQPVIITGNRLLAE